MVFLPQVVFVFPGVGSQYTGMGKGLLEQYPVAKRTFEEASDTLGFDVANLCFSKEENKKLNILQYSQIAIFTVSVVAYRVFQQEFNIIPVYAAGYSLGEYTALCCSGSVKFHDMINLLWDRGVITNSERARMNGTMAWTVNLDSNIVCDICQYLRHDGHDVYVSAYDNLDKISISGSQEAINMAGNEIVKQGGLLIPSKLSGPYHSILMKNVAEEFFHKIKDISFEKPNFEIISNNGMLKYSEISDIKRNLYEHMINPIMWKDTIDLMLKQEYCHFVEIGPKTILKYLIERDSAKAVVNSFEEPEQIKSLADFLWVTGDDYADMLSRCLVAIVSTPNRNADEVQYMSHVYAPYHEILQMYEAYRNQEINITDKQMRNVIDTVKDVLDYKKLSEQEIQLRINKILNNKGLREGE